MTASLFGAGAAVNVNVNGTVVTSQFIATAGQVLFNIGGWTYVQNTNSLQVFINGQKQITANDFTETSESSFTLVEACEAGDIVEVIGFPELNLTAVDTGAIVLGGTYTLNDYISDQSINVKNYPYLALGDGSVDDYAAVAAALAVAKIIASASEVGCDIYFPPGKYKLDANTLLIDADRIRLRGAGGSHSTIYTTREDHTIIKWQKAASAAIFYGGLSDLKLESTHINVTSGSLLYIDNLTGGWFDNLKIDNWYDGITMVGANRCYFKSVISSDNGRAAGQGNAAWNFFGSAAAGGCSDVHLTNIQVLANSSGPTHSYAGIVKGCDGLYFTSFHCIDGDYGLVFSPNGAAGQDTIASVFIENSYFDKTNAQAHISFQGTASSGYKDIQVNNTEFRQSANNAVVFTTLSTVPEIIKFASCVFRSNAGSGIKGSEQINPPKYVTISDCTFENNNTAAGASDADIFIRGDYWQVMGGQCITGNAAGSALDLRNEATNASISGIDLRASTAGTKVKQGSGTNNLIWECPGFAQKNKGTAVVNSGATTVVVNHGLAVTPVIQDFRLSFTNNVAGISRLYVTNITSTQFTINVDTAPGANTTFAWSVDATTA